jgi:hypothetical protein
MPGMTDQTGWSAAHLFHHIRAGVANHALMFASSSSGRYRRPPCRYARESAGAAVELLDAAILGLAPGCSRSDPNPSPQRSQNLARATSNEGKKEWSIARKHVDRSSDPDRYIPADRWQARRPGDPPGAGFAQGTGGRTCPRDWTEHGLRLDGYGDVGIGSHR